MLAKAAYSAGSMDDISAYVLKLDTQELAQQDTPLQQVDCNGSGQNPPVCNHSLHLLLSFSQTYGTYILDST